MPAETRRLRLRVDPTRCTALGFCAEFCPEHFTLDDWGYAWVRVADAPIECQALLRETARRCPTGAILVELLEPDATPRARAAAQRGSRRRQP